MANIAGPLLSAALVLMTFAKVSAVCGVRGSSTVNTGGGSDNTSTSNGSDAVVDTFDFSENTQGLHRIVGGVDAGPLEFPWQISLRRQVPLLNIDRGHMCGGSIVNEQFVVTAAHCVDEPVAIPASYVVVVGDQNINKKDSTEDRIGVTYTTPFAAKPTQEYGPPPTQRTPGARQPRLRSASLDLQKPSKSI
ncbi:serine-type enodpeptidase, putative [Ixodes scapularis]|uniref:Serine-type enodpeptidase, putative n=1 Tax=Ixodes scapularis TaxID=6945 RepID=B7P5H9_IXOSC|nr:serine-type enodpeptidase, putative [Ixodes scapularis]|eukprot:XP_002407387.1 serine-type enodpeptidase, putative [Ixodes scapularis]